MKLFMPKIAIIISLIPYCIFTFFLTFPLYNTHGFPVFPEIVFFTYRKDRNLPIPVFLFPFTRFESPVLLRVFLFFSSLLQEDVESEDRCQRSAE